MGKFRITKKEKERILLWIGAGMGAYLLMADFRAWVVDTYDGYWSAIIGAIILIIILLFSKYFER